MSGLTVVFFVVTMETGLANSEIGQTYQKQMQNFRNARGANKNSELKSRTVL